MILPTFPFWAASVPELLRELQSRPEGLTGAVALERLRTLGANRLTGRSRTGDLGLLLIQFKSPMILILLFAATLSFFLHDRADALIILFIVFVSGLLGFWQERGAARAVEQLIAMVKSRTVVRRDGATSAIPFEDVVPGDVVELSAGAAVPGDCLILESRDLFVNEAALTGETYPVEKAGGEISGDAPLAQRRNVLFMGTHVVSGTSAAVVVHTGGNTELGRISQRLTQRPQETEFERGVRRFGYLLMEITLLMLVAIFAINVYLERPVLDSFMFALALAVGLTPQLLPAILALKKQGNVVGYMGDGINDATALHAADVSISVEGAVDVAKEAADIVLLEKDLGAVVRGVRDGRKTFANTLKYVFMATSANFGNMFSMAGASLFLPFLPLLPEQILLTNLLTDFPEMTIATDSVDPESVDRPRRWDIRFIRRFMLTFGLLSSIFDYLTFGALLLVLKADPVQFRTGWFVESVVSACLIVLVVRSQRPFYRTMPSKYLIVATHVVVGATLVLPYSPLASLFQFTALPLRYLALLAAIVFIYIASADIAKRVFYKHIRI